VGGDDVLSPLCSDVWYSSLPISECCCKISDCNEEFCTSSDDETDIFGILVPFDDGSGLTTSSVFGTKIDVFVAVDEIDVNGSE
jgi:hypothetical protein